MPYESSHLVSKFHLIKQVDFFIEIKVIIVNTKLYLAIKGEGIKNILL